MRTNVSVRLLSYRHGRTHEGAPVAKLTPEQALRRSVMSCFLGEKEFYEDGVEISARILTLAGEVDPKTIASMAVEARTKGNLRHAPLLLLCALAKHGKGRIVADAIEQTIQRADELTELVALYWKINGGKRPLSAQLKKGLARAFLKFDAYQLGKYSRNTEVKLRDILFLVHAKPDTKDRGALWKQLVENKLESPLTWEVELSAGKDKRETFEQLIREGKLGYLALLRNLRGMAKAGCNSDLINRAIVARKGADKVLPFRFIAAARAAPRFEKALDTALCENIALLPVLKGKTVVLIDVSVSMEATLSAKSDLTRMDAAAALASVINANDLRVFTFSDALVEVPARRGMVGVDCVIRSQIHMGTRLGAAVNTLNQHVSYDRLIVVTDEQAHDYVPQPKNRGYLINVASAQHGVGYGTWVHIDGFSENAIRFIVEYENIS